MPMAFFSTKYYSYSAHPLFFLILSIILLAMPTIIIYLAAYYEFKEEGRK